MINNFFPKNRVVCVVIWKTVVEPDRSQMTVWRMRFPCWITKAIDTHSEYVLRIAFPQQQWLRERASVFRYTYIACLVDVELLTETVCLLSGTDWILSIVHYYRGADKSLARPNWKKIISSQFFVRRGGHCCRGDLVGRTTFRILFLSGLRKLEFGRCSLFPPWSG